MITLEEQRDILRKQYAEHPSKILEIRGKLLNLAIEARDASNNLEVIKAEEKPIEEIADEVFGDEQKEEPGELA